MSDASLERPVVCFAHDDVDVAGVVVDQRLAQRDAICRLRENGAPVPIAA
jgi:hypothetical protein